MSDQRCSPSEDSKLSVDLSSFGELSDNCRDGNQTMDSNCSFDYSTFSMEHHEPPCESSISTENEDVAWLNSSMKSWFPPAAPLKRHYVYAEPCELIEKTVHVREQARTLSRVILQWTRPRCKVLVIKKPFDVDVSELSQKVISWLVFNKKVKVYLEEDTYYDKLFRSGLKEDITSHLHVLPPNPDSKTLFDLDIDFVLSLGGDGTVLHISSIFQQHVPPTVAFHLGSLGFLTVFDFDRFEQHLNRICDSPNVSLMLRTRLNCTIVKSVDAICDNKGFSQASFVSGGSGHENLPRTCSAHCSTNWQQFKKADGNSEKPLQVLNEVVIDRGPSSYMALLDVYCDMELITTVQADGLIIATPTGSTAYSLSAGGSIVHPDVPCVLLTPICAHTLSFRPLILPDASDIRVVVPQSSRATAWASFDGRNRTELKRGDTLCIRASKWPLPCICDDNPTVDWFSSLQRCLHWNLRDKQKSFSGKILDPNEITILQEKKMTRSDAILPFDDKVDSDPSL